MYPWLIKIWSWLVVPFFFLIPHTPWKKHVSLAPLISFSRMLCQCHVLCFPVHGKPSKTVAIAAQSTPSQFNPHICHFISSFFPPPLPKFPFFPFLSSQSNFPSDWKTYFRVSCWIFQSGVCWPSTLNLTFVNLKMSLFCLHFWWISLLIVNS